MAQFFQQLLAIATVVEDEVRQHEVEAVGLDLTQHLGRIARTMDRGHAQRPQHQAQRIPRLRVAVDDQHPFFGQRLLQNQQHFIVVERTRRLRIARAHASDVT